MNTEHAYAQPSLVPREMCKAILKLGNAIDWETNLQALFRREKVPSSPTQFLILELKPLIRHTSVGGVRGSSGVDIARDEVLRFYRQAGLQSIVVVHLDNKCKLELPASLDHLRMAFLHLEFGLMWKLLFKGPSSGLSYNGFMQPWRDILYGSPVEQLRGEMQTVHCYGLHSSKQVDEVKERLEKGWKFQGWCAHASFEGFVRAMLFKAGQDKDPVVRFAKRHDEAEEDSEEDEMKEMESLAGRVVLAISACQREGVNLEEY